MLNPKSSLSIIINRLSTPGIKPLIPLYRGVQKDFGAIKADGGFKLKSDQANDNVSLAAHVVYHDHSPWLSFSYNQNIAKKFALNNGLGTICQTRFPPVRMDTCAILSDLSERQDVFPPLSSNFRGEQEVTSIVPIHLDHILAYQSLKYAKGWIKNSDYPLSSMHSISVLPDKIDDLTKSVLSNDKNEVMLNWRQGLQLHQALTKVASRFVIPNIIPYTYHVEYLNQSIIGNRNLDDYICNDYHDVLKNKLNLEQRENSVLISNNFLTKNKKSVSHPEEAMIIPKFKNK